MAQGSSSSLRSTLRATAPTAVSTAALEAPIRGWRGAPSRPQEALREALALEEKGFKRVLLVLGEDERWGPDYIIECVRAIYEGSGMRIIHVNAPPMKVAELKKLKRAGIGLYQSFQETYHRETYERVHPWGAKKDYDMRLSVMDRALEAGFNDVGIGALFGLYDFRFDALASISHSKHLFERFATHAHTISIPRLRPAAGSEIADTGWAVTDEDMERIVSVYRLSVPSAGVVVTTRESVDLRARLIDAGASQLSATSSTQPGGYSKKEGKRLEQFSTNDHRSLEEVMASIARSGNMPSLCTSCYRVGRVGESFTEKTIAGEMDKFCEANAILTMKEFLVDNKANGNEALFERTIERALGNMKETGLKGQVLKKIAQLEEGKKDLFF